MTALPRLHVVVNPTPGDACTALTGQVLGAGAKLVQIRVKNVPDAHERLWLTQGLVELCRQHRATALVNDRADVAVALDADGVHGGVGDLPCHAMRKVVGPDRIVGMTARTPDTARAYEEAGADYLGVGPVYESGTKTGLPAPIGPGGVETIAAAVSIPVIAISGITVERVPDVLSAGAHGVAVISAVSSAPDPARATRQFIAALGGA